MPEPGETDLNVEPRPRLRRRRTLFAVVLFHIVFAAVIQAIAVTLSVEANGLLAGAGIVLLMSLVSVAYFRSYGREPVQQMKEGPVGLSRAYLLFVTWAILGYLAVLLVFGSKLGPGNFVIGLVGFYALFAVFVFLLIVAGRQHRDAVARIRTRMER